MTKLKALDGYMSSKISPPAGSIENRSWNETNETELQSVEALQLEMERLASKLKDLVLSQPPEELLGYLWDGLFLDLMNKSDPSGTTETEDNEIRDSLFFALEYVHAILSCFDVQPEEHCKLEEAIVKEIIEITERLKKTALLYCMNSSYKTLATEYGDKTNIIAFFAKTKWVQIRGNRYPVLEEEFFQFILKPHEEALQRAYGINADEVSVGIQAIANSMREGFALATKKIHEGMKFANLIMDEQGITLEKAVERLKRKSPESIKNIEGAIKDLFGGGLCNLSQHTKLPSVFLEDLSFNPGENKEFFAPGPFCGTPFRTIPARIKPLIRLNEDFFATDPMFVRDAAYRAIQRGLLKRLPEYREEWNQRQKILTESAFTHIFKSQLNQATVLSEIYYQAPDNGQWLENDTLILFDDVLIQVEAKAGIEAMHSPVTNFSNHMRAIHDLVVKAYRQTKRFFEYLSSAPEVDLYTLKEGEFIKVCAIRLSDYSLIIPIGLTVESFSPFSAMCKEFPEIKPLLWKYPFVSMSIDDLFILNKFLPTTGELFHYLLVRQQVAGIRGAFLFDEIEHLGAYIVKNRFDMDIRSQLENGKKMVIWDTFSQKIDKYFEGDRWLNEPPPSQGYPDELRKLLQVLAKTHTNNWLKIDRFIRDLGSEAQLKLAKILKDLSFSLKKYRQRWFVFSGERPLLIWLYRDEAQPKIDTLIRQAEVITLAINLNEIQVLLLSVNFCHDFIEAKGISVKMPLSTRADYEELMNKSKMLHTEPLL